MFWARMQMIHVIASRVVLVYIYNLCIAGTHPQNSCSLQKTVLKIVLLEFSRAAWSRGYIGQIIMM